ncbi:MAG: zinc ribbon domain-containing protein [Oscillospiraceae bacterium]|nr:zinc ribbon domain-containing protein [Oscillospiraceae bacterium]
MFFVIGINQGQKDLNYSAVIRCGSCGSYSRAQLFVTYSQLLLFFIPTIRWGKRYYVKMACCGSVYELDREKGKQIENGMTADIAPEDLILVRGGRQPSVMYCNNCGKELDRSYSFCPYCGERI